MPVGARLAPYEVNRTNFRVGERADGIAGLPALKLDGCCAPVSFVAAKYRPKGAIYLISTVRAPLFAACIRFCWTSLDRGAAAVSLGSSK